MNENMFPQVAGKIYRAVALVFGAIKNLGGTGEEVTNILKGDNAGTSPMANDIAQLICGKGRFFRHDDSDLDGLLAKIFMVENFSLSQLPNVAYLIVAGAFQQAMSMLHSYEGGFIKQLYGIERACKLTLEETAGAYGVNLERARQIEQQGYEKLARYCRTVAVLNTLVNQRVSFTPEARWIADSSLGNIPKKMCYRLGCLSADDVAKKSSDELLDSRQCARPHHINQIRDWLGTFGLKLQGE